MKTHILILTLLSLQLLIGCKETTIVNELPDTGLIITSIDPEMGGPGMAVEIEGLGFGEMAAEALVTFDGIAAPVEAASPTRIITSVPEGVVSGPVSVRVGEETAVGPMFTVDRRVAFTGAYETQIYEMRAKSNSSGLDTTVTIEGGTQIDIVPLEDNFTGMEVYLKEFVEDGFRSFYLEEDTVGFRVLFIFDNQPFARTVGDGFKLDITNFEITNGEISLVGEVTGKGIQTDDTSILFSFFYRVVSAGGEIDFTGEVMLEKQ